MKIYAHTKSREERIAEGIEKYLKTKKRRDIACNPCEIRNYLLTYKNIDAGLSEIVEVWRKFNGGVYDPTKR